ncbi:hypothetical protein PR003_g1052 [Phytophthora rubi]|uniref:Protein kinase domain-containing protein n=1 Tax=Phytophthora rubi TaxID=129364 RepID=A0A6A4G8N6_9STRA|nr:hypothetical protein PR003_g1052 [Phytophthora rubi]
MHAVTEYVKGTSLCDILRRAPGQRLPEARAKEIFRQIAAGVGAIHAQRVIHRDLKLENILQDESSGHVTIIDFGFSDFEDCGDPQMLDPADDMAPKKRLRKKNFCGTPSYMAPEVVASERYDGRPVDVWSLGVLLYVMLCGKFPFQGVSFHQLYQKLRSGSQQLVLPPALSVEARALLQAVLIVDPAKRPSASGLYCCSWLQESQNHWSSDLQPRNALRLSFETWSGITPAICSALTELYGVQLSPSSLDQFKRGLQQLKRLKAFIDLATVQSSCHFQKIVDTLSLPPSLSSDSIDSQENEKTESKVQIVESSTRHKQQLEKLIGLVKASLAQNTFV